MKARLVPLYYQSAQDPDFVKQVDHLKRLLVEEAELLEPVALGAAIPREADAVVFPQMLGQAYTRLADIKALGLPILVITSEFGTLSMWDWEINTYLASEGVSVLAPNTLEQAVKFCRACTLKRQLRETKMLAYQDNPGEGFQAEIFKRFYWWEKECVDRLQSRFGVTIVKKSFKELGEAARAISDAEAEAAWAGFKHRVPTKGLAQRPILSAIKMYMAVKRDLDKDPSIAAAGINCLNESHFSDTTPCLAWNLLFEDRRIVWGCEADLVSMMTELMIQRTLGVPFLMSNLYPYLMGNTALKHEHIPYFPPVPSEPENYVLVAHCGYLGVVPQSFAVEWALKPKVLAIVDQNAHAMDARIQEGDVTLLKLMPPFDVLSVVEAKLEFYAQFENSDCLNGAVLHVPNGPRMLKELASHHYILTAGKNLPDLEGVAQILGLTVRVLE
jgi:L-fucose isomerase-like protein